MAVQAQGRGVVVLHEEFAVRVVVWIVAGSALQLVVVIQPHFVGQRGRIVQLPVGRRKRAVVNERDRMIIGEIGSKLAGSGRHCCHVIRHLDRGRAVVDHANGDGSVVAAEAQFCCSCGLADRRLRG